MSIKSGGSVALLVAILACGACSSGNGGTGAGGAGGTTGSGGSTGSGGTGGGSALPVVTACKAFCVAEKDCKADTTVEDCYDYRCDNPAGIMPFASQPASCQTAFKAFYDCLATQSMICDNGQANIPGACMTQFTALSTANCSQS
jgi:hypothetical protein